MIKTPIFLILFLFVLTSCASKNNLENEKLTKQSIESAMSQAAEVDIPETEPMPEDILDELMPGGGVAVQGLIDDIKLENTFDMSVSNAPARLFFMSLVKDTDINMVVHPSVEGEISLDLKNVTVREVMNLTREVYGYEYKKNDSGYIVLPARIQSKIYAVNYLNVSRSGESTMTVSSGQIANTETSNSTSGDSSTSNSTSGAAQSSSINTTIKADFWSDLRQTLLSIIGDGNDRSVVVDRHAGLVIVRAMPGELRDVEIYLSNAQDSLQRQVILETKIIEVKLSDSFQSGIDWAALSSSGRAAIGTSGLIDGSSAILGSAGNLDAAAALSAGSNSFTNLFAIGGIRACSDSCRWQYC